GDYIEGADPAKFDLGRATRDPAAVVQIPPEQDIAGIKSRPKAVVIHLLMRNGKAELVVLPVYGHGFASTLYGYIGLTGSTDTVAGLAFYQHGETPGLGALIDDRKWRQLWVGKTVRGAQGEIALGVARGPVVTGTEEARFQVDGITGATWTGQGVTNLLRYWLGPHGFGPYLGKLRRASR
ncbi:MAG: NADH:ubiquinone reductase (Na(+)-transporting) subunit C, partial [Alphaproteobacteria bacterium]|nr:NADH:ubiquinone reductase (Na(+)-transporting) subunit C [Alphaproteobacteria bacterium]